MFNQFGIFMNLDYAHKPSDACSFIWQEIMDAMLANGFSFEKRAFTISTSNTRDEVATEVRKILDSVRCVHHDLYDFISDCYILNFDNCSDLTLPDTSGSIDVEHVSHEQLEALGYKFHF